MVTLAGSGLTGLAVSKQRPNLPIIALGSWRPTLNHLNVLRGVVPVAIENRMEIEELLMVADPFALRRLGRVRRHGGRGRRRAAGDDKETNTHSLSSVREAA
jgi:pyruvate kinase